MPKIKTSGGTLAITKVQVVEQDSFGNKPKPGYQMLFIWLEEAEGSKFNGELFRDSKGVYIVAEDGSRTERYTGGLDKGKLFVGFTPPANTRKFKLYWLDTPPIDLEL